MTRYIVVVWWILTVAASGCNPNDGQDTSTVNGDHGKDSDSQAVDDIDTAASMRDTDTVDPVIIDHPEVDDDSDGYTNLEGDCNDLNPFIGPMAIEDLGPDGTGDGVDNDCDGEIDEVELCDDKTGYRWDKDANSLAESLGLCDSRFLLSASKYSSAAANGDNGYENIRCIGERCWEDDPPRCLSARSGSGMVYLGTGPMQGDANYGGNIDPGADNLVVADNPQPLYRGYEPYAESGGKVCDLTQFKVTLRAPANARGFYFDFLFASAEYPEWIEQDLPWNDKFYAIMEYDGLNNGAPTNIAFDSNGNDIEVHANFFENDEYLCDESGSPWDPSFPQGNGSTGWLRTTWDILPGALFSLIFSIHDAGEDGQNPCGYSSMVLLDSFTWITEKVEITPGTVPIIIE